MHSEAVALFHSVQKRGNEVEYETGKWLSSCAEKAVQRLERNRASTASAASSGGSLFGGIGSFVDSTVKFLVTGADSPAAPLKADAAPDRTPAQQPVAVVAPTGRKIAFFNPHAGRQQIAQQLHQQPGPQAQQSQVAEPADVEREQARTAAETAPPPASPTPRLDRSSSDPVKSDASKSASGSPGEKQKGKGGWGIGSFIGGIVSKVLPASKGVEVDLGEESTMYFNEKLGRYVERGKEDEAAASAVVAPPPMMTAWSEQSAVAPFAPPASSHTATSQDSTYIPGGGSFSAAQAAAMSAPSQPLTASGPPMPSGTVRAAAPPSSSALGKSRWRAAFAAAQPAFLLPCTRFFVCACVFEWPWNITAALSPRLASTISLPCCSMLSGMLLLASPSCPVLPPLSPPPPQVPSLQRAPGAHRPAAATLSANPTFSLACAPARSI